MPSAIRFFLSKFNLDPSVDNTPTLLKTASASKKVDFLHKKVGEALNDMLHMFRNCQGILPDMKDFPLRKKTVKKRLMSSLLKTKL